MAHGGVWILHSIFDTGSFVHLNVGHREDALAIGARDFALIPVLINPANQNDPLPLQTYTCISLTHRWTSDVQIETGIDLSLRETLKPCSFCHTFLKDISTPVSPVKLKRAIASPYSNTCTGALFFGWAFSVGGSSWISTQNIKLLVVVTVFIAGSQHHEQICTITPK